jgi:carbonic anhydrase
MEEDIYTLSRLKEGETIKIHGIMYKLIEGRFVDVTARSI